MMIFKRSMQALIQLPFSFILGESLRMYICFCFLSFVSVVCINLSLKPFGYIFFLLSVFPPTQANFSLELQILILWLGADLLNNYFFHLQLGAGVGIRISMFLCTLIILFRLSADSLTVWHLYCHH